MIWQVRVCRPIIEIAPEGTGVGEVTNELMYEVLKAVRAEQATQSSMLRDLTSSVNTMRDHMGAFLKHEAHQDAAIAEIRVRLDRIERRLELVD
jgi:hypothetical protein